MNARHRNKAITGLALWFVALLAFAVMLFSFRHRDGEPDRISGTSLAILFCMGIAIESLLFFWAGHHLAKAKGYPKAVLLPGLLGPCLQVFMVTLLLALPDKFAQPSQRTHKPRADRSHGSEIGRIVRYRRNALAGIAFGLFGILAGLFLVLVRLGISRDGSTETVAGIFVFLGGYCGVITGCWWWVKAKHWSEGVVFIGVLPLVVLFIPWVRLIYIAVPALLPTTMVMMPLILLVVVAVLPDKSGISKRSRWDRGQMRALEKHEN